MRAVALAVLVASSSGCAAATQFDRSLEGRTWSLHRTPSAEAALAKDSTTLRIGKVAVAGRLPPATSMSVRRVYVPLLLFNYFDETWRYELGRAQVADDVERFIEDGLVEGIRRGTRHTLVAGSAGREVEVTVTRIEAHAATRYRVWAALLPYSAAGDALRQIGPVVSSIEAEVLLREGAEPPRRLRVVGQAEVGLPRELERPADVDLLMPALVEGLSRAMENLSRRIVEVIDASPEPAFEPLPPLNPPAAPPS